MGACIVFHFSFPPSVGSRALRAVPDFPVPTFPVRSISFSSRAVIDGCVFYIVCLASLCFALLCFASQKIMSGQRTAGGTNRLPFFVIVIKFSSVSRFRSFPDS